MNLDATTRNALVNAFWTQVQNTISWVTERAGSVHVHVEDILLGYERLLKQIDENLTLQVGRAHAQAPVELVIGCDGYAESIASVMSLVQAAPSMQGVHIRAFHERLDEVPGVVETLDEEPLALSTLWFHLSRTDELHLSIFLEEFQGLESDTRVEAVMYYLDALIGEFDLMTRVATLNWYVLPEDPLDFGLKPLSELRTEFDRIRASVRPLGVVLH
ncbi:hypothetical protein [Balneatrix alpica]|uniref:Uncharacterized protein n=1 Tax=Balneatrix alpica TaxID=75684 RepID=A0ABV5Z9U0_9GAMM|nr:hypothetical protein [Balneatrix alpica]